MLILSEKSDLFLACKHRSDGKENLYLIIKGNMRIFKLFTGLKETIGQVIVITCIFMEGIEYGINFNANF
jgi:hypothetical protein